MAERPDPSTEYDTEVPLVLPSWARNLRLTKEQLAAAQRTRDYHVHKLQARAGHSERAGDGGMRGEH